MQRGTIQGKINEKQLIELLEQFSAKEKEASQGQAVEFKRNAFDSDDDLDIDNLGL